MERYQHPERARPPHGLRVNDTDIRLAPCGKSQYDIHERPDYHPRRPRHKSARSKLIDEGRGTR
ncbi:hypothetical protein ACFOX2_04420 [Corynebacterium marambiense]|uniref:hypothetical protein n=1 Tax=Corynebacterium marambiense TaxID=2765364 RepID=UPI00360A1BBF